MIQQASLVNLYICLSLHAGAFLTARSSILDRRVEQTILLLQALYSRE